MGGNAATKALKVVNNIYSILAIELYNAAQALEFRRPAKSSAYLENFLSDYRKVVPFVDKDTLMYIGINKTVEFLEKGKYVL
jgi:histidine ammonia-lyase